MNSQIKIKSLSLGDEIHRIRREERKWLKSSRWLRGVSKGSVTNRLTVEEATSKQTHAEANFWLLRQHRLQLRPHARAAHIAYCYLRGRKYSQVESKVKNHPDYAEVIKLVKKYGEVPKDMNVDTTLTAWFFT